jgi:hypothetical protein
MACSRCWRWLTTTYVALHRLHSTAPQLRACHLHAAHHFSAHVYTLLLYQLVYQLVGLKLPFSFAFWGVTKQKQLIIVLGRTPHTQPVIAASNVQALLPKATRDAVDTSLEVVIVELPLDAMRNLERQVRCPRLLCLHLHRPDTFGVVCSP